jgi:hypothetical protein
MPSKSNYAAKIVRDVVQKEIANALNEIAELYAGGVVGDRNVGIASTFTHASPPPAPRGGPPGVMTGTLKRSWRAKPSGSIGRRLIASVGTNVEYAAKHEFGTHPYVKAGITSAEPFVLKRLDKVIPNIKKALARRVRPL